MFKRLNTRMALDKNYGNMHARNSRRSSRRRIRRLFAETDSQNRHFEAITSEIVNSTSFLNMNSKNAILETEFYSMPGSVEGAGRVQARVLYPSLNLKIGDEARHKKDCYFKDTVGVVEM